MVEHISKSCDDEIKNDDEKVIEKWSDEENEIMNGYKVV